MERRIKTCGGERMDARARNSFPTWRTALMLRPDNDRIKEKLPFLLQPELNENSQFFYFYVYLRICARIIDVIETYHDRDRYFVTTLHRRGNRPLSCFFRR